MISSQELVVFLDDILNPFLIKDSTYNSLQFEGKSSVKKIGCTVDVSLESLQTAVQNNVDFLITHHGLIWGGINKITGFEKKRFNILFQSQLNLYCSHLPLDIHPQLGNNVLLIDLLGMQKLDESFFEVGYMAEYSVPISYDEFISLIKENISKNIQEMNFCGMVKKIAVCSGGAALNLRALFEAKEKGADTFLSGETNSLLYHYARELEMNVVCAGHYATETLGVQAVMMEIQKKYGNQLEYQFLDLPTKW